MVKKDLVIAVLATFCLTATLFMIIPTRSTPAVGEYDPWLDYNDDGRITMGDIIAVVDAFGTTGTAMNKTALILELQSRLDSLNSSLLELQSRLDALENKTWHFVVNFTLSKDNDTLSPLFFVPGKEWRTNWTSGFSVSLIGWAGFKILDDNGYIIDAFELRPIISGERAGKGVYYVQQGEGNYCIELCNVGSDGISFTIEAYY